LSQIAAVRASRRRPILALSPVIVRAPWRSSESRSLQGLKDRFDALADRRQVRLRAGFVAAAGADDANAEFGGLVGELATGVALVTDRDGGAAACRQR
jgi:hypothetical protein